MGSCGMHIGPRAVVRKAMRQGYYWPTMHADAKKKEDKVTHAKFNDPPVPRLPKHTVTSNTSPCPLSMWDGHPKDH
ncbi:hypothetical protein Tco_1003548 [Tanacetum coccineum]|uniref:Integrase zinc-binding domain-containing protein n=1 Tax=Tanacetum coccineum TaxID=301880 RepID=A0ABQ5FAQ6_9ASTR